jgi:hypothetical protein
MRKELKMNQTVVGSIYGTAIGAAICLSVVYGCWLAKQRKKDPPPQVKLSDNGDEEKLACSTKYIKVICRD